jgi:hypothetical protein
MNGLPEVGGGGGGASNGLSNHSPNGEGDQLKKVWQGIL